MTTPERPRKKKPAAAPVRRTEHDANTKRTSPPLPHVSLPKLERTKPQRILTTVGRFDDAPGTKANRNPDPGRPLVSAKDVIEHGIRVAQEVIDQQIGSGERILRHLRRAPIASGAPVPSTTRTGKPHRANGRAVSRVRRADARAARNACRDADGRPRACKVAGARIGTAKRRRLTCGRQRSRGPSRRSATSRSPRAGRRRSR